MQHSVTYAPKKRRLNFLRIQGPHSKWPAPLVSQRQSRDDATDITMSTTNMGYRFSKLIARPPHINSGIIRRVSGTNVEKLMKELKDELSFESKNLLCAFVFRDIIGRDVVFIGPFGKNRVTYLDYVASGRPLKCIEQYIRDRVMPTYSNTHTEVSYNAQQTTHFREEARNIIKECVNASADDVVIFTGSGATSAVNKLIHAMDIRPLLNRLGVTVFIGPYEHHSNILPWREIKANVITIPQTEHGLIDLKFLKRELKKCRCGPERLLIGTFSAASNVTGILTDVNSVAVLMHTYGGYAFFDYACAAPYTEIDMNPREPLAYKDAVFISPHKFIGGPQTPGILVAKHWVFRNVVPHGVGGGTVVFVRRKAHRYLNDIEEREEGGTPAIIESIRAGLVFKLKASFTSKFILDREVEMLRLAKDAWSNLPGLIILGNLHVDRLPIFSMMFLNPMTGRFVHHDFIAMVFNDVFGIQVRSGCACAGPYGMDLLGVSEKVGKMYEKLILSKPSKKEPHTQTGSPSVHVPAKNLIFKPGFVRLSFPYFISENCFDFVLKAVRMISEKAWRLLPVYNFDQDKGKWRHVYHASCHIESSLHDVTFKSGQFDMREHRPAPGSDTLSSHLDMFHSDGVTYSSILQRAERIFEDANKSPRFIISDQKKDFSEKEEALRWFMLPSEAVDIIRGGKVQALAPEKLPFLPVALKERLSRQKVD